MGKEGLNDLKEIWNVFDINYVVKLFIFVNTKFVKDNMGNVFMSLIWIFPWIQKK